MPEMPKLRQLEAVPQEMEGRLMILLRDPEGISDQVAVLPPPYAQFLFEMMDGTHTFAEIGAEFTRRSGETMDFEDLAKRFDESCFLEGSRVEEKRAEILAAYRGQDARPVAEIRAYPEEPVAFLDSIYQGTSVPDVDGSLRALAIPHLDLRFGGRAAAMALSGLADRFSGDTVVVLGVGHSLARQPYALTELDFETPAGAVPLARDLCSRVVSAAGSWVLEEELIHRDEHSVEYAATLLRHALPGRELKLLPVLCGSFHGHLLDGRSPESDPRVDVFSEILREEAGDALIVASVDLAHLGPHYGDREPLTRRDLQQAEREDRSMLACMADRDAEGFFEGLAAGHDRRRVCGLSAIYTMLRILPESAKGSLIAYEQPVFPEEGNTVTICSMAWTT